MTPFDITCALLLTLLVLLILSHVVAYGVTDNKLRRQHKSLAVDIVDVMKQADRSERELDALSEKLDVLDDSVNGNINIHGLCSQVKHLRDEFADLGTLMDAALGRRIYTVGGHFQYLKFMSTEWLKLLLVTSEKPYVHAAVIQEELKQRELEALWLDKKTDDEEIREEVYGE